MGIQRANESNKGKPPLSPIAERKATTKEVTTIPERETTNQIPIQLMKLINKELKQLLLDRGAWEAFLGNITDYSFTKHSGPTRQLLEAFPWNKSAEGYDFWKKLYLCLLG